MSVSVRVNAEGWLTGTTGDGVDDAPELTMLYKFKQETKDDPPRHASLDFTSLNPAVATAEPTWRKMRIRSRLSE